jgi:hypothetical protein
VKPARDFVPADSLEREIFNTLKKVRLSRRQKARWAEKFKSDLEIRRRVLAGTETLSDRMYLDFLVGQK